MKIRNKIIYFFFLSALSVNYIFTKKFIKTYPNINASTQKEWFNKSSWFKVVPLQEILNSNSQISYMKFCEKIFFDVPECSIFSNFPRTGSFDELFVLTVPNGRVQGLCGHVIIDNKLPEEMARAHRYDALFRLPQLTNKNAIKKISGNVAVIAQHGAGQFWANYYHALYEVFGRLAILEMSGIEYDWLYIPMDKKFVRDILELWGIDFSKIISPTDECFTVEADMLIVPSLVINTDVGHKHSGNFQHPVTLKYVKDKLLNNAKNKNIDISNFPKKLFISRKDSSNPRRILNEDDLFNLFKKKGFERYEMTNFSVAEQILLFNNAEIVVSEQGTGLANILFCKPNTTIVEIFQALIDNCFWWVSHVLNLKYIAVQTLPADIDYFANWHDRGITHLVEVGKSIVNVPLHEIEKFVETI